MISFLLFRRLLASPAKRWRPGVVWTLAVTTMIVGTDDKVLLIKSGAATGVRNYRGQ